MDNTENLDNEVVRQSLTDFKIEREPFRNVKDSVFKWLFADPKYLLQMYQTLHPEDKDTKAEDLDLVTLDTVIIKDIHNDLGFAVESSTGAKLLVLAEAQSTWSVNIVVRGFLYLAQIFSTDIPKLSADDETEYLWNQTS